MNPLSVCSYLTVGGAFAVEADIMRPGVDEGAILATVKNRVTPMVSITKPVFCWVNSATNPNGGGETGTAANTQSSLTLNNVQVKLNNGSIVTLTFGGQQSVTIPYGQRVFSDALTGVTLAANTVVPMITVRTLGQASNGSYYLYYHRTSNPGTNEGTLAGNHAGDFDNAGYYYSGALHGSDIAPFMLFGIPLTTQPNGARIPARVVQRGDSISADGDPITEANATYPFFLMKRSGLTGLAIGTSGEGIGAFIVDGSDVTRTLFTREADTLLDEYGVNDGRGAGQVDTITNRKKTVWPRWLQGAKPTKFAVFTLTPINYQNSSPTVLTARAGWNTWLRTSTNQDYSVATGRSCQVKKWNGAAWVDSGARGVGTDTTPLDVFLYDTALLVEVDSLNNTNLWRTDTSAPCWVSAATVEDGIHMPNGPGGDSERVANALQPRYNAMIAAAPPVSDTDPPGVSSAVLAVNGLLTVTLDESGSGGDGFGVTIDGTARTVTGWTRATATTVTGQVSGTFYNNQNVRLSYNPSTGNVTDNASPANELDGFTNYAVTNNGPNPPVSSSDFTDADRTLLQTLAATVAALSARLSPERVEVMVRGAAWNGADGGRIQPGTYEFENPEGGVYRYQMSNAGETRAVTTEA